MKKGDAVFKAKEDTDNQKGNEQPKKKQPAKYEERCELHCLYKTQPENVPSPMMRRWEDLHDKMIKRIEGGYHILYDSPSFLTAGKIKQKQYLRQTTYRGILHEALKKQINPLSEDVKNETKECEEMRKKVTQIEVELEKMAAVQTIEKTYRDYSKREKHMASHFSMVDSKGSIIAPKGHLEPNAIKRDFIEVAKELTRFEERLIKCVENLWSAVGPLVVEYDDEDKKMTLTRIYNELLANMTVQQSEIDRMSYEAKVEITEFENKLAAEFEKKNSTNFDNFKHTLDKQRSFARSQLLSFYKNCKNYEIQWFLPDTVERFQESIRVFTQSCVQWMMLLKEFKRGPKMRTNEMIRADNKLIEDVKYDEQRRVAKSLDILNKDHEEIQSALAKILYRQDTAISRLKEQIKDLSQKADVWKNTTKDLMGQFEKFIKFFLESHSYQSQYLLSMKSLYERFLDDFLEAEEKLANKIRINRGIEKIRKRHYVMSEPPDRLSRETSSKTNSVFDSSTKSAIENQESALARNALDFIASGKLIIRPNFDDNLTLLEERETDAVVQTFGCEEWEVESSDSDEVEEISLMGHAVSHIVDSQTEKSPNGCSKPSAVDRIDEIVKTMNLYTTAKKIMFGV